MNFNLTNTREGVPRILLGGVIAVVGVLILYFVITFYPNVFPPQVVNVSPTNNSTQVSPFTKVAITFDRIISTNNSSMIKINPSIHGDTAVSGNTLTFVPTVWFTPGQKFIVTVDSPEGVWGIKGKSVTFSFTIKTPSEFTQSESNKAQSLSDLGVAQQIQKNSTTLDYQKAMAIYNLIQQMPYNAANFSITYAPQQDLFQATIKENIYSTNKQATIDWLNSQGISDLSWINVQFGAGPGVDSTK